MEIVIRCGLKLLTSIWNKNTATKCASLNYSTGLMGLLETSPGCSLPACLLSSYHPLFFLQWPARRRQTKCCQWKEEISSEKTNCPPVAQKEKNKEIAQEKAKKEITQKEEEKGPGKVIVRFLQGERMLWRGDFKHSEGETQAQKEDQESAC